MTEPTGFTDEMGEPDLDAQESDRVIDNDVVLGDEADLELDRAYSPPERPLGLDAYGTTLAEQREGEGLDRRLAAEEPDPALAVEPPDEPVGESLGESFEEPLGESDAVISVESSGRRSGRLVAPDEGLAPDEERDLVASDVGIDGGAASAEEAAVHLIEGGNTAVDEGSSR